MLQLFQFTWQQIFIQWSQVLLCPKVQTFLVVDLGFHKGEQEALPSWEQVSHLRGSNERTWIGGAGENLKSGN